eukprot:COSAG01_NODE_6136_length_3827_cov_4.176628_1_plen_357_part_00
MSRLCLESICIVLSAAAVGAVQQPPLSSAPGNNTPCANNCTLVPTGHRFHAGQYCDNCTAGITSEDDCKVACLKSPTCVQLTWSNRASDDCVLYSSVTAAYSEYGSQGIGYVKCHAGATDPSCVSISPPPPPCTANCTLVPSGHHFHDGQFCANPMVTSEDDCKVACLKSPTCVQLTWSNRASDDCVLYSNVTANYSEYGSQGIGYVKCHAGATDPSCVSISPPAPPTPPGPAPACPPATPTPTPTPPAPPSPGPAVHCDPSAKPVRGANGSYLPMRACALLLLLPSWCTLPQFVRVSVHVYLTVPAVACSCRNVLVESHARLLVSAPSNKMGTLLPRSGTLLTRTSTVANALRGA